MAKTNISASLKLDGEREFKQAISEVNAGLRVNKSEMELLIAQYSKNADSVEALTAKDEALNNQINSQTDKVTTLEQALASSIKEYGEADKRTMTWQTSLNQAKTELIKMNGELDNNQNALKKSSTATSDFNDEISQVDAAVRANKSEMELLTAQYRKNEESVEGLTAKGEALSNQINSQTDKVKKLEQAFNESAQANGNADKRTLDLKTSLNQAKTELIKMSDALGENSAAVDNARTGLSEYNTSVDATGKKTNIFGDILSKVFDKFGIDIGEFQSETSEAFTQYKDGLSTSEQSTSKSSGVMATALGVAPVLAAGALVSAIIDISKEVRETANEVESSSDRMQISLGLTADEADAAAKSVKKIYTEGLTDDKKQAEDALTSVTRLMGLTGDEATQVAKRVLAIGAGGEDVKEITRSASTLMRQFGITSIEALDVIAGGLQTTANKNGDLLDVLNEFSISFDRIGYSAEEFMTMLISAGDAGAFSIDKSAETVAEFYNKAASGSQDFADGLKQLGMNSESMMRQITSGGETAEMAFEKVVTRLANVSDETRRGEIASKLFASQWEDVGTNATLALANTSKEIVDYTGKAEESYNILKDSSATFDKSVNRSFENIGNVAKEALVNALIPLGSIKEIFKSANQGILEISELFKQTGKEGGEAAGKASSDGYNKTWKSNEKQILDSVRGTANSANDILSNIGSNGKSNSQIIGPRIPPYALGTAYHSGGFARVNDRQNDPNSGEIIDLPTGSRVYPNGTAPSGGGDTYNITIDAKNVREFNDIVTMAQNARQQRRAR